MTPNKQYPNSWYVMRQSDADGQWRPELGSVGNKSYATGYLTALEAFYPHPPYQLIDAAGNVSREVPKRNEPRFGDAPTTGDLREAVKSALRELVYLYEQTNSREGGSVWLAINRCRRALGARNCGMCGELRDDVSDASTPWGSGPLCNHCNDEAMKDAVTR